jgi:acetoin utilization deacetylase AcuC-like enzyme
VTTRFYTDEVFQAHDTGYGHPECGERLRAVLGALQDPRFAALERQQPSEASIDQLGGAHHPRHVEQLLRAIPSEGQRLLDADTVISPQSGRAALRAAGAVCQAVDAVLAGEVDNAFCAVRPPGHHATPTRAMGFCLFNNIAVAAAHACIQHGLERVAIIDFDVHHGNGTQDFCWDRPELLYVSSHQSPLYPGTGSNAERGASDNIVNLPLAHGSGSMQMREVYDSIVFPAVERFRPQLLLVSAGFDAHRLDPLAGLEWDDEDYRWLAERLLELADRTCAGRLVATLEGGYHLSALGRSVAAQLNEMMRA